MKKKPELEMQYYPDGTFSISFDGTSHYNVHLSQGFKKAFETLTEILAEKYNVRVTKLRATDYEDATYYSVIK